MDETVEKKESAETPAEVVTDVGEAEAKIAALELEKAKLIEEGANWKVAALKYKRESKEENLDETEEEKMKRVAREVLAESRLAEITKEQDALIKKTLKENKELKLAQMNKGAPPAAMGTHSESIAVKDTLITPEQMAAFKARGWSDKTIERYKKNLVRYGTR